MSGAKPCSRTKRARQPSPRSSLPRNPIRDGSDPVTLGTNEYFVVGDNRSMPPQDHTHGPYDRSRIVGKAML